MMSAPFADAPYMSTVWKGDEVVGETTSGDWGFRVNKSIALGVVKTELATPGTELEIEIFWRAMQSCGARRPAPVGSSERPHPRMIAWVQSKASPSGFAFAYCGVVYALLYLLGAHAVTAVSLVLLTVFPLAYGSAVQLVLDPALRVSLAKVRDGG